MSVSVLNTDRHDDMQGAYVPLSSLPIMDTDDKAPSAATEAAAAALEAARVQVKSALLYPGISRVGLKPCSCHISAIITEKNLEHEKASTIN